jgi:hypothetical protein
VYHKRENFQNLHSKYKSNKFLNKIESNTMQTKADHISGRKLITYNCPKTGLVARQTNTFEG